MSSIRAKNIPQALRDRPQWVVWKNAKRGGDKPTKVPYATDGKPAKANDPSTWSTFTAALEAYQKGGYAGVGYEFVGDDPFCGIDLDGCRDIESGNVAQWARELILEFDTYAEMSPSQTGVKLFAIGKLPFDRGRKLELCDVPKCGQKTPAIEVYQEGRYFALTGWKLRGVPGEPQARQAQIEAICNRFWPAGETTANVDFHSTDAVIERARNYIAKIPPAVSGQAGHNQTFHVACVLTKGFSLDREQALALLSEWNEGCQPPWSERELAHKIDSAAKQGGQRGYLRHVSPERWDHVNVPKYELAKPKDQVRVTTLAEAAEKYIERIRQGEHGVIELGLADLDYAIAGGVEAGEMIVVAGRPNHGKSLVGLQAIHNLSRGGMPSLIISQEMSSLALGKRMLLHMNDLPQEHWPTNIDELSESLKWYRDAHSPTWLIESVPSAAAACEIAERFIEEHKVQAVAIDYLQLLRGAGKGRYEQVTDASASLRQLATKHAIVLLVLCQMNRQIEARNKFVPSLADLRDSGSIEQDADVVIFCVWPHRINHTADPHVYQFFVAKNRNRPINQNFVECRIEPSRQRIDVSKPARSTWQPSPSPSLFPEDDF